MALTKEQKQAQVAELTAKLKEAKSVMFSHYIGLNVEDASDLRGKLLENDAEMKVAKKTLMKLAFKEAGYPDIEPDNLEGPVACIFSFADAISGAQTAFKFSKDHDQVKLIGGVFDGKLIGPDQALELAKMASREELLAKFVGLLNSPLVSFASMCTSPLGGFARALSQVAEKGGISPEAEAPAAEVKEEAPKAETEEVLAEEKPAEEAAPTEETPTEEAPAEPEATEDSSDSPEQDKKEEADA